MTKISFSTHPHLLGFERLGRLVELSVKNSNDGYPPYNIEVLAENHYRITIALAGFTSKDIDISLETNQLMIKGVQKDASENRAFLHRGIATRQFQRSFVLADGVEVGEAEMKDGMLHIDLKRNPPEEITKIIPIKTK